MSVKHRIKKIWASWCNFNLHQALPQVRSKSALQRAIEQELAHLKQENTPLTGSSKSSIFQR
ncbi:hypothetical protein MNBD_NITROSPIRAE01-1155 [hydrothermal vent metagenome]|uniref:Uncharacterized protein n=1 Tax=hydrothermal vent metagenome TaxID=652676 RepID=A0A3B1D384_9ZZZZ